MKKPKARHGMLMESLTSSIKLFQGCTWDLDGDNVHVDCYISFNGIQYKWDDKTQEFYMPRLEHTAKLNEAQSKLEVLTKSNPGHKGIGSSLSPETSDDYKKGIVETLIVYGDTNPDITEFEGFKVEWRKNYPLFC